MAKSSSNIIAVVLAVVTFMLIGGCHTPVKPPEAFAFKSEQAMQNALRGSWILQEYADSIDAGMTPKLLEFMVTKSHAITYSPDGKSMNEVRIGDQDDKNSELLSVDFDFKANKLTFYQKGVAKDTTGKPIGAMIATFTINDGDTVLQFQSDSADGKIRDFVKYDINKCPEVSAYEHLVNSKFIAGKYYNAEDKDHIHNIVLTRCGSIQGAENISPTMSGYDHYIPLVEGFGSEGDKLTLTGAKDVPAREVYWVVDKDSLTLTSTSLSHKLNPIVLLRKR